MRKINYGLAGLFLLVWLFLLSSALLSFACSSDRIGARAKLVFCYTSIYLSSIIPSDYANRAYGRFLERGIAYHRLAEEKKADIDFRRSWMIATRIGKWENSGLSRPQRRVLLRLLKAKGGAWVKFRDANGERLFEVFNYLSRSRELSPD